MVQKQTLGEVETRTVIWWPVVSGIYVLKTIKIFLSFFKLQSIMLGMFFNVFGSFQRLFRVFRFPQVVQKHTLGEVGT